MRRTGIFITINENSGDTAGCRYIRPNATSLNMAQRHFSILFEFLCQVSSLACHMHDPRMCFVAKLVQVASSQPTKFICKSVKTVQVEDKFKYLLLLHSLCLRNAKLNYSYIAYYRQSNDWYHTIGIRCVNTILVFLMSSQQLKILVAVNFEVSDIITASHFPFRLDIQRWYCAVCNLEKA